MGLEESFRRKKNRAGLQECDLVREKVKPVRGLARSYVMKHIARAIPVRSLWPLPSPTTEAGDRRDVGIEIELGGLKPARVAEVVAAQLGGEARQTDKHDHVVEGSRIGDVKVYLDTRYRKSGRKLVRLGVDLAEPLVPVEIVTPPIAPEDITLLDRMNEALRDAGAEGTRDGILLGYGVHLNPQVKALTLEGILPVLRAFAVLEDLLRKMDPIDPSRRMQPFVDPWPRKLADRLAGEDFASLDALMDAYLQESPSRNHGLDALPLFAEIDHDRVKAALGEDGLVSARPTWHYRLPDCRIDEEGWSLAYEWNRWVMVERVAEDSALLERLAEGFAAHRDQLTATKGDWAREAGEMVEQAGVLEASA